VPDLTVSIRYSVNIRWSDEDGAYIATVPELPGCLADGKTVTQALKAAGEAVGLWIDVAKKDGRAIPKTMTGTALKPYELRLAAKLLREASDEFANHGCNDFDLFENGLSHAEAVEFALEANDGGEDDEEREGIADHPKYAVMDWLAMLTLAKKLEREANSAEPSATIPMSFEDIAERLSKENGTLRTERDTLKMQLQRIQDAVRGIK
jgi:predicted RNase H-like HicB family nuclease